MANPHVSVLILAFNHDRYLFKAIESVVSQRTSVQFEILIGEDCSTDASLLIARTWAKQRPDLISVVTDSVNVGVVRNYHRLVRQSRGSLIAVLDGDDYWLPDKLQNQIDFLVKNSECVAVYTNALTIDETGTVTGKFNDVGTKILCIRDIVRHGNFLNTSSMLFRSTVSNSILGLHDNFIDYAIHVRHAIQGPVGHLAECLVAYRVNSVSSMISRQNDLVRHRYWETIKSVPIQLVNDRDFASGLADFLRRVAFRSIKSRRLGLICYWWPKVIQLSPFGTIVTSLFFIFSLLRATLFETISYVQQKIGRVENKILYRS